MAWEEAKQNEGHMVVTWEAVSCGYDSGDRPPLRTLEQSSSIEMDKWGASVNNPFQKHRVKQLVGATSRNPRVRLSSLLSPFCEDLAARVKCCTLPFSAISSP